MKATLSIRCALVVLTATHCLAADPDPKAEERRHVEQAGTYSFIPPKSWDARKEADAPYAAFYAPLRSGENILFSDQQSTDTAEGDLDRYHQQCRVTALGGGVMTPVKTEFKSASGVKGFRLLYEQKLDNGLVVRQSLFVFPKRRAGAYLLAVCSGRAEGGEKLDTVFADSMQSFRWERTAGMDQEASDRGFRAVFPCPQPMQLYRVKFETLDIDQEGFTGWKYGLPVYGDDMFMVICNDLSDGLLKGKSDREIINICYSHVPGIEDMVPFSRRIGTAETEGYEFVVTYDNGGRERNACLRIGNRFYRLVAQCVDSQPGAQPDPFASSFADGPEVDTFFDSFELLEDKAESQPGGKAESPSRRVTDTPNPRSNRNSRSSGRRSRNRNRDESPATQGGGFF